MFFFCIIQGVRSESLDNAYSTDAIVNDDIIQRPASPSKPEDNDALLRLADQYRSADPDKLIHTLTAINVSELEGEQKYHYQFLQAYAAALSGDRQASAELFRQIYTESTSDWKFEASSMLVTSYAFTGQWASGLPLLTELIENLDNIDSDESYDRILAQIANFYNQSGQHKLAEQFAAELFSRRPGERLTCLARALLIEANLADKNKDIVEQAFNNGIRYCANIGENLIKHAIIGYKAEYLFRQQRFEQARDLYYQYLDEVHAFHYPTLMSVFFSGIAKTSYFLNDYEQAYSFALKSLEIQGDSTQFLKSKISAYETLYKIARLNADFETALRFYMLYANAETSRVNELQAREVAFQQARQNVILRENQISILDKQNALLTTRTELAEKQSQNNQLLLALTSILLLLLFLWIYKNRRIQKRLRVLAQIDSLTGVNNRNHFTESARELLNLVKHEQLPVSFILFDLDFFKNINDSYGHQIGDWALKHAVTAARSVCRSNDIIGRMGGEEFALLLTNCNLHKAAEIAEKCRETIESIDTSATGHDFTITASFGVSDNRNCGYQFDKLYGCADAALYRSKSQGRNQVYHFNEQEDAVFGC